jgi:flagellar biosynthesis protein FlhG
MSDQACKLRELSDATAPTAPPPAGIPIIAVTGSRPGVGTTTVAVNLAAALSDRGEHVVLVDAAEVRPNLAQIAGTRIKIEHDIAEVMSGGCSAAAALVSGPVGTMILAPRSRVSPRRGGDRSHPRNFNKAAGAPSTVPARLCHEFSPRRISDRRNSPRCDYSRHAQHRLLSELQSLDELASVIVVDTGTGLSPWTQRFWTSARLAILVTTPDDQAVMDTYAAFKRCTADAVDAELRVLANQCEDDHVGPAVYSRLSIACERFLSRSLSTLPSLPVHHANARVGGSTAPRVWESPDTPFGHAVLWLAQAVSGSLPLANAAPSTKREAATSAATCFLQIEQNHLSRRVGVADNTRHHTGVPVGVKLAELRRA